MLKGIPPILSPELLKVLMEMGHSDDLLICDGNYPRNGSPERCIRMDGHGVPEILEAIMQFFPLDKSVESAITYMAVPEGNPYVPEVWEKYKEIFERNATDGENTTPRKVKRFDFYEEGKKCYACIATSESALFANVILKKGVIKL